MIDKRLLCAGLRAAGINVGEGEIGHLTINDSGVYITYHNDTSVGFDYMRPEVEAL